MKKIEDLISEAFDVKVGSLTDETVFYEMENWDSMNHMLLINNLETEFEKELTNEQIINIKTIGDVRKIFS